MAANNDLLVLGLDIAKTQTRINSQLDQILASVGKSKAIDIKVNLHSDQVAQGVQNQVNQARSSYSQLEKWQDQFHRTNLNGIDMEIKAREEASRRFSSMLKSQMEMSVAAQKKLIVDDTLATNIKKAQAELTNLKSTFSSIGKDPSLSEKWQKLFDSSQVVKSQTELTNLNSKIGLFKKELGGANAVMGQAVVKMVAMAAVMKTIQLVIQGIKAAIQKVEELDSALTEFNKVSDLSADQLKKVTQEAYDMAEGLGRAGSEIINAATEFKKSGYDIEDSMEMAKSALIMSGVGDGIDNVTDASSTLIAVLKGFNVEAEDTLSIVDKINEVANNSPIAFEDISEGLTRVSGTLAQTGTSIDETIGLLTGGYAQLRNIEKVSSGLVMVNQRLRGMDEDGSEIDGLKAKMQDAFGEIGVTIRDANGELRSTYDILKDYAAVYDTLSSSQKQYYSELAAGNRQVTVINAIMQQWEDVEKAVSQSTNSVGSATKEYEIWQNSIEGIKSELKGALEELATTAIDSDWIKTPLKLLTEFVKILTKFADNDVLMGGLGLILGYKAVTGVAGIKNLFSEYTQLIHLLVSGGQQVEKVSLFTSLKKAKDSIGEPKIVPSHLKAA